jgi:GTPase SAR1 family protein
MDDDVAIEMFLNALRQGKEKVYTIRVMVVGHGNVGKTTLTRRLVGEDVDISTYESTNGVDMWKCQVTIPDGQWLPAHKGTLIHTCP